MGDLRYWFLCAVSVFSLISFSFASQNTVSGKTTSVSSVTAVAVVSEDNFRSEWLWENKLNNNRGGPSVSFLGNDDPNGGKSCIFADDFLVPEGETWKIDTIRVFMFWAKKAPDKFRAIIFPDNGGWPNHEAIMKDFTFTANCPSALTTYSIIANTTSENIELPAGTYWLSVMGVYETAKKSDEYAVYWVYKDTLIEPNQAQCMDSIGIAYTNYPTDWMAIWFGEPENQYVSTKFSLKGTKTVSINNNKSNKTPETEVVFGKIVNNKVQFDIVSKVAVNSLKLYDSKGKLTQTVSVQTGKNVIDCSLLANGVYLYQVIDLNNLSVAKGKFAVSR
jgi:hypothetical protein